jgi:CheY-like chemotaxis protein
MTTSDAVRTATRCPTVLVVDDEPDHLGLMTTLLNREGCTVIAAASGEHALSLPPDLPVDLMILDLLLPGVDGWQLAAELKIRFPAARWRSRPYSMSRTTRARRSCCPSR